MSAGEPMLRQLVDDYRAQCLWFLRDDYYPASTSEWEQVLRSIERYGDLTAFRRVRRCDDGSHTTLQRDTCRLLAADRRAHGESDVAGGVALGVALETARMSRDLDVFHDTSEAVARSFDRDRHTLAAAEYVVDVTRERPGYVEATLSRGGESLVAEWARDSAFRFFPLWSTPTWA